MAKRYSGAKSKSCTADSNSGTFENPMKKTWLKAYKFQRSWINLSRDDKSMANATERHESCAWYAIKELLVRSLRRRRRFKLTESEKSENKSSHFHFPRFFFFSNALHIQRIVITIWSNIRFSTLVWCKK